MLQDYSEKIEKLTDAQLLHLIERYQKTIDSLYREKNMAEIVAMLTIVKFKEVEIDKKETELRAIKAIMAKRGMI
jgi:3-dehydroquinate synthetase